MKRNRFKMLVILLTIFISGLSYADEASDAKTASEKIMSLMSEGKYAKVFDSHMSNNFKSTMTRDSWLANLSIGRQMLGGLKNKKFIEIAYLDNEPATGYQGSVYALTYLNTYSGLKLYERVVVINQDGKGFKLAGFWANPAQ